MPREVIDYKARIDEYLQRLEALHISIEPSSFLGDLRTVVTMLNEAAEAKPLAEYHEDNGPVLWWSFPVNEPPYVGAPFDSDWPGYHTHWTPLVVPATPHPAPQPQPVLSGYGDYGAAIPGIERPCTCHPDDNPPVLCARQYALNECRAASEPTEAQIEAWQLLADLVAGLEATHWSSWQTTAHFDSALDAARAALAAKDE